MKAEPREQGTLDWVSGSDGRLRPPCHDRIDVWWADLEEVRPATAALWLLLSGDELDRARRYLLARDRERFVLTRAVLRVILGDYLGVAPARLCFTYGPFGKPALRPEPGRPPLFFNLSHSREAVAFAVSLMREVGVDVQHVRAGVLDGGSADIFLSVREKRAVAALADPARRRKALFDIWTRKEAFLKALGIGHGIAAAQVEVPVLSGGPGKLRGVPTGFTEPCAWSVLDLDLAPEMSGALAFQGIPLSIVPHRFTL